MSYEDTSGFVRVRALVNGRVQHVGFRYWACEQAERLGLTGSVENLPDGRVEVVFQGKPEVVNEMKEKLRQGPSMAVVNQVIFYRERVKEDETFFNPVYW
ncbi:MAG: acylphosphatase [Synergistaceae bacterium]|nr:acylphosphatase [Synergistaceae bacterium]